MKESQADTDRRRNELRGGFVSHTGATERLSLIPQIGVATPDMEAQREDRSGALNSDLMIRIEDEDQSDFTVITTTQLIPLSNDEGLQHGAPETLHQDHLATALACSFFYPPEAHRKRVQRAPSTLPLHRLRRVMERMRELRGDLDLQALATESGYSRSHFLRMFRASTGCTPHRYLLQLRLERAKELMRQKGASLIDIAATCGFSSHAHLSKVFRQLVGVPPSEYRRNL
jgi:AraC family transcriptional regulator